MHELSLARRIVEIAEKEALAAHAAAVTSITLKIGDISGVDHGAFDFAWEAATKDTMLESARQVVKKVPGRARCQLCTTDFELDKIYNPCPACGSYAKDIYQGEEFMIESMTIN